MSCLFFDDPKNNKGFIHYKPLKMCKTAVRFLRIFEWGLKKASPKISLRKPKWWLSDEKADSIPNFGSGMKCSFPEHREGLTEWKAEIGDCVQDICSEALFPKWSGCLPFRQASAECRGMCWGGYEYQAYISNNPSSTVHCAEAHPIWLCYVHWAGFPIHPEYRAALPMSHKS